MTNHEMHVLRWCFTHAPYWIQITFKHFDGALFIENSHSLICEIRSFKGTSFGTRCHISLANEYYRLFSSDAAYTYCTRVSTILCLSLSLSHTQTDKCPNRMSIGTSSRSRLACVVEHTSVVCMFAKNTSIQREDKDDGMNSKII